MATGCIIVLSVRSPSGLSWVLCGAMGLMQCQNRGTNEAELLTGDPGQRTYFQLTQTVGRINFPGTVGLRSSFSCWLSGGDHSAPGDHPHSLSRPLHLQTSNMRSNPPCSLNLTFTWRKLHFQRTHGGLRRWCMEVRWNRRWLIKANFWDKCSAQYIQGSK